MYPTSSEPVAPVESPAPEVAPEPAPPLPVAPPDAEAGAPASVRVSTYGRVVFRSFVPGVPDITSDGVDVPADALEEVTQAARSAGVSLTVKES